MGCLGQRGVGVKTIQGSHSSEQKDVQDQTEQEKVKSNPEHVQDVFNPEKNEIPGPISPAPPKGSERSSSNEEEPLIPIFRNKPDLNDNNNIQEEKKKKEKEKEKKEKNLIGMIIIQ